MKYTFPCGCSFDAEEHNGKTFIKPYNELEVPLDCPACWKLVQGGHTLGIFQLDSKSSSLGKFTAKRMIPENEHHLAQLFAIVRPGCMDAKIDDVSVTQHFMKRKNGDEEIHPIHPAISDITAPTQEFMIYQEQAMYVAQKIAGFSGSEGYALVKAAAKKKPELMAKMREKFIAGCKAVALVNEDDANRIFDQIEASQRYSFNQCLDPSTMLELENGDKIKISKCKIGDRIKTPSGASSIINKFSSKQVLYKIKLDSGHSITCSLDHKFKCSDNNIHTLQEILDNNYQIIVND